MSTAVDCEKRPWMRGTGYRVGVVLFATVVGAWPAAAQRKPVIHDLEPRSGPPGTVVHIMGRGFGAVVEVRLGSGLLTVERALPNRITARVPSNGQTGRIAVKTSHGTAPGPEFHVREPDPGPVISSFVPEKGTPGTEVVLKGHNFSPRPERNLVVLDSRPAMVRSASVTELRVLVPQGAETGRFVVEVLGSGSSESERPFEVIPPPVITGFAPRSGQPGTQVTITGNGFASRPRDNLVRIHNARAKVLTSAPGLLVVEIPDNAASGRIWVRTSGTVPARSSDSFTVERPPSITAFSPLIGVPGSLVTVYGSDLGRDVEALQMRLGDLRVPVRAALDERVVVEIPAGAISGRFTATVRGLGPARSEARFQVVAPVSIDSFEPGAGEAGTTVTIRGSGFSTSAAKNRVKMGGRALQVVSATSSTLQVRIPGGPSGPLEVGVSGAGTARTTVPFVVTAPPKLDTFEPKEGPEGTEITVRGKGFGTDSAVISASLGGKALEVRSVREDVMVVRVPRGARSGRLRVSIPLQGSSTSENEFRVLSVSEAE